MSLQVESSDAVHPDPGVGKSRLAGLLLALIVVSVFGLINLPYQYIETDVEWIGYLEVSDAGNFQSFQELPVMAGWPLRYWIRYTDEDSIQDRLWAPARLVFNIAVSLVIAIAVYMFLQLRRRTLLSPERTVRTRLLFDCFVALLIIGVPGGIFLREYRITHDHRQIALKLARVGSASLSCWIPTSLANHIPSGVKRKFARIRQIHVFGANQTTAGVVTSLPTVVSYHDYNGKYDARPLEQLASNPHFCALQLSRRDLSDADVAAIAQMDWLVQLRLAGTNLNANQLQRLDHLRLRHADFSFTKVALSDIGTPSWSSTVQHLWLSRPPDGIPSSLTLEGWPELQNLRIRRRSPRLNDAVLEIRLVDLPRLESLYLDRVQKHDLCLRNVPRLALFEEGVADLRYVVSSDTLIPGLTWVRDLEIDGADSLTDFGCYARDLESFSIRGVRSLRSLAIGSYLTTVLGEVTPQDADREQCQEWIRILGAMEGPSNLDLDVLPLEGVDLTPLTGNRRIRRLQLGGTGVRFAQVKQLQGMDQLEALDIRSTPLQEDQLAWVLDRFLSVRELAVDVNRLTHFDLRGCDRLREMRVTSMGSLDDIQIVDLPQLKASIRLTQTPKTLDIRNAPSLRGLAVEGPWPKDSKLGGLRDLEWFTGGGDHVDDEIVDEVLNCASIERLTLAYPAASQPRLRQIGRLKNLTFLAVPGADVDDAVVRQWNGLDSLWEINLDDTNISVETFAWLSRIESLRRLSIKRVSLSEAAADALAEVNQVSELYLEGVVMESAKLRRVLQKGNLETLDLSGWKIDDDLVDLLCSDGAQLKHLVLRGTGFDQAAFERILRSGETTYIDMGELPENIDADILLELDRRAHLLSREVATGWRLMLRPQDDVYPWTPAGFLADQDDDRDSRIPVSLMSLMSRQLFAPRSPSAN